MQASAQNRQRQIPISPEVMWIRSREVALNTAARVITDIPRFAANTDHSKLILSIFEKKKELKGQSEYVTVELGQKHSTLNNLEDMKILEMLEIVPVNARGTPSSVEVKLLPLGEEVAKILQKESEKK